MGKTIIFLLNNTKKIQQTIKINPKSLLLMKWKIIRKHSKVDKIKIIMRKLMLKIDKLLLILMKIIINAKLIKDHIRMKSKNKSFKFFSQ